MLSQEEKIVPLDDFERELFEKLVPTDHYLRKLATIIDFERFRAMLSSAYSADHGRPSIDPVRMLKLELICRHFNISSDRVLMRQAQVNVAYRLFLNLGSGSRLPHHTSMTYFRARIGVETLQVVFHELLAQARELGFVRDRLRLKDATHIIANIAVPSTIRLLAQTREQLLQALTPFAAERAQEERQRAEEIHQASEDLADAERLLRRVTHLRTVLAWADDVPNQEAFLHAGTQQQEKLRTMLATAHKILADRDNPKAGDKIRSVYDPDARCGKHGDFYHGYLFDMAMDADSELITGVNVLPANGDEGGDALHLIEQEEEAHGNDVEALSIDGAGYRGTVLRELTNEQGPNLEVFVPPSERIPLTVFSPQQFTLSEDGTTLTCPAGQTTKERERTPHDTGVKYRFSKKQCDGCSLREQCLTKPQAHRRMVIKNDYEADYQAAQAKARTPEYAKVRKEHPAVERKLSELVRRHGMRNARYRGLMKVMWQCLATAIVVNMKRILKLVTAESAEVRTGTVRAEAAAVG